MRSFLARRWLARFRARYDYDVSYLEAMLRASPRGFFRFARVGGAASHREIASKEAYYAAKLAAALAEDCGPCTQLVVDMAREAGVDDRDLEAVLARDESAMSSDAVLGLRFAEGLIRRLPSLVEARAAVLARWGERGVIDLSLAAAFARLYPMTKAGLGYGLACQQVRVGPRSLVPRPGGPGHHVA